MSALADYVQAALMLNYTISVALDIAVCISSACLRLGLRAVRVAVGVFKQVLYSSY